MGHKKHSSKFSKKTAKHLDVKTDVLPNVQPELGRSENGSAEGPRGPRENGQEDPTTLRTGQKKSLSAIERLNEMVRLELASVETYDLALSSIQEIELRGPLQQIRDSHEKRLTLLRERIHTLGGQPARNSGVWGAFARAIQRGADLLGNRVALAALEEGEEQVQKRYTRDIDEIAAQERDFVERELMKEQVYTLDLARSLQKFVKAA